MGCGKPKARLQGYCIVSSMAEMTRKGNQVLRAEKSSEMARVGLATSPWISNKYSFYA